MLTYGHTPVRFVDCNWNVAEVSPGLRYLHIRFPKVPDWQISAVGHKDYETLDGIRVTPAHTQLSQLIQGKARMNTYHLGEYP